MNIWIYRLRNTSLNKCLKSPISEDPLKSDMVNVPKHYWNLSRNTFTIFIDPFEGHSGWKSLSEWYAKSKDCLLTHSLLIISILFLTEAIYCNILWCNFIRNEKYFLYFFLHFGNLESVLNIFFKKDNPYK